jgi:ubiquinone/menaquinone biosynthesis C-methylase UbiE
MPALCFEDPAPYVHFTTTPVMKSSRKTFIDYFSHTVDKYDRPFRILDIGTGDGTLLSNILTKLLETEKIKEISEVMIVDPSKGMLDLASKTILDTHPGITLKAIHCRIQELTDHIDGHFDIAMSSLAFHHMPYEDKTTHLKRIKKHINNFIIFELDANNDTPDINTPELDLSVYFSYGRIIDLVFSHDAPIHLAEETVDKFLLTEAVSFLTQERGTRTDYHMLRTQWHDLFQKSFGSSFECRSDVTCYSDEYLDLFALHYGLGD